MTLSHAFEQIEKEVYAAFVEVERIVLGEILAQYDIDTPFVILDEKECRKVLRCEQTYYQRRRENPGEAHFIPCKT